MTGDGIEIVTLRERPDLRAALWDLTDLWPRYMLEDPVADLYFADLEPWADHVFLAHRDDDVVGRGFAVSFAMGPEVRRRELPPDGWDGVIRWAWIDRIRSRPSTHLAALEVTLRPETRGSGLAARMIEAMRDLARRRSLQGLVAPVRPSRKEAEPDVPMRDYVARQRPDGLPDDPWLRLHVRLGGEIVAVCPTAMTIPGTLAQWRDWTGLPFDRSGPVHVPGALAPVHCDLAQDHAVYVEPNVWVRHRLD